ncbi:MAG TPA: hypothetical protein VGW75_04745 [Solirubrobacteraceae bacterium]|nr:hypothetical protein [Solirubrobacteraceae bacterium]
MLAVVGWLVRLSGTQKDTRKMYVDASTGRRHLPPASRFHFAAVRAQARELIAELGRDEVLRQTEAGWRASEGSQHDGQGAAAETPPAGGRGAYKPSIRVCTELRRR